MSKYSEIADALLSEIKEGTYSSTGKLPTEFELSQRFGVSRQTVRQAIASLKHSGAVYQVQGSGTYVSKEVKVHRPLSSSPHILVVCTYISDYIFPSIIRGIESVLSDRGCRLNLVATGNKVDVERKILSSVLEEGHLDGIIVEGTRTNLPNPNIGLYRQIMDAKIPLVFLHCSYPELSDAIVVGMDDYKGGRRIADALVADGCRSLGGIFKSDDRQGSLRYSGFIDGAIANNVPLSAIQTGWFSTEDVRHGYSFTREQLENVMENGPLDGVVCYNDQVAAAFVRDMNKYGFKLPMVYSFDKSYIAEVSDSFRSLGHRKAELGHIAAEKIVNMLAGEEESSLFMDWL